MNRRARPWRAVALVSALSASLISIPAQPASAGFGIALRPGHADPNDPSTKAYFKPSLEAGQTFTDEVIVTNTGDAPVELVVSEVDGLTAPTSGAVYGNRQDPVQRAGSWISAANDRVTVPPKSELAVPFTVSVPTDAASGDHLAGIAFEDVRSASSGGNFAVTQVVRAVMGVQVVVPGPGAFTLHVDDAALQALPGVGAASVVVKVGNNGVRLGKAGLSVTMSGPNRYQRTVTRSLDTILPRDTIDYPLAWPDVLEPGDYAITATATVSGGSAPVVFNGTSRLETAMAGVPAPGVVTPAPVTSRRSGNGLMWAVVILVAFAGVGGGLYLGRRKPFAPAATEPTLAGESATPY